MGESKISRAVSPTGKVVIKIGLLVLTVLVFLIPLIMIRGIIAERRDRSTAAIEEIISSRGGRQVVVGPVVSVPITIETKEGEVTRQVSDTWRLIPEETSTSIVLEPETRSRGIFHATVYVARVSITGTFRVDVSPGDDVRLPHVIHWEHSTLDLGLPSGSGLLGTPVAGWNDSTLEFDTGTTTLGRQEVTLSAGLPSGIGPGTVAAFSVDLVLTGGGSFMISPVAGNGSVTMSSSWPAPSFIGSRLPTVRDVSETGFAAGYQTTALAMGVPGRWLISDGTEQRLGAVPFGVELVTPVDHYVRVERSVKYGPLFVLLPFVALFLFEVFAAVRIHPIQYLLVGVAKVVFYLLLLSLSEHLAFGPAYLAAAGSTAGLLLVYGSSVLERLSKGLMLGAFVAAEYVFLYAALSSEDYALLIGSVGLFVVLACVMVFTRRINWYEKGGPGSLG
jgi:inner membrane protein